MDDTQRSHGAMVAFARWCIGHRRRVVVVWLAVAIVATVVAGSIGNTWATNFGLPGTESQRAADLLNHQFRAQSGDLDTVVFHVSRGTIDAPPVRAAMTRLLRQVRGAPHVVGMLSPYSPRGAVQVSRDRRTAFATVQYDKRANLLANNTGQPVLTAVNAVHVPGLRVAAGGQVIEQAEGFNIGQIGRAHV